LKISTTRKYKKETLQFVLKTRENKLPSAATLKKSRLIVRNLGFKSNEVCVCIVEERD
jgi:hypothetical protein